MEWISATFRGDEQDQRLQQAGNGFIPERLIDVDESNTCLILRTDLESGRLGPDTPVYAALSYCWGPAEDAKQQLTSTSATIAERRKRIRDDEMTEVLRDAISVTRALKIPYLWVDALCILQDDISDWERQCVDVAKLYAAASVTICAASSTTCRQGFLHQRGPRIRIPFRSIRRPDIAGSYFLQFKYAGLPRGLVFSEASADTRCSRWGNRGWVFQENLAASRKFVFGNANIHYYSPSSVQSMGSASKERAEEGMIIPSDVDKKEEIYQIWASVLCEYSRFESHSFTKSKDILPALSGLTAHYHQWVKDDFHAGLWKGDLFRGLMWYWEGDSEMLPSRECCTPSSFMRHDDCPVPSWCPLGRGMFITYGAMYKDDECFTDFRPEYQFLEAHTVPVGTNPFGEIQKDWNLRVRSHVLDLEALNERNLEVVDTFDERGSRGTLVYDGKHIGCFELDFSYDAYGDIYSSSPSQGPSCMADEIGNFTWVLLGSCKVRNIEEPRAKSRRARGACGLILFSSPNSGNFCRVGAFFPSFPEKHHDGLMLIRRLGKVKTVTIV